HSLHNQSSPPSSSTLSTTSPSSPSSSTLSPQPVQSILFHTISTTNLRVSQ
ncbi:uncharacterized protein LOC134538568, partial [Bacillus rossius redtenbacheri]|uniref:uncharacterized protein LOC134538568 n=1 Tax=Bacillus rossius redtenbacheri TaxID=93214 RepID=UPI002FDD31C7